MQGFFPGEKDLTAEGAKSTEISTYECFGRLKTRFGEFFLPPSARSVSFVALGRIE